MTVEEAIRRLSLYPPGYAFLVRDSDHDFKTGQKAYRRTTTMYGDATMRAVVLSETGDWVKVECVHDFVDRYACRICSKCGATKALKGKE